MLRSAFVRRSLLPVSGALLVGLALSACSSAASPESSDAEGFGETNIQLSWIKNNQFAGEFMADDLGFYEENGFSEVEMTAGGSSATSAEAAVMGGQALVGISADMFKLGSAIEQGSPVKVVAATYQRNPFAVISLESAPIATPAELVGKTVAVSDGDTLKWEAFLTANDVDPADVTVVPFLFDTSILATGQVDALMNYTTNGANTMTAQGTPAIEFLMADYGLPLIGEAIIASDDTIENDRDKLEAFLEATIRGWKAALDDPENANIVSNEVYSADQNYDNDNEMIAMTAQIPLIESDWTIENGLLNLSDDTIAENIASLNDNGVDITAEQMFDLSIVQDIYDADPALLD